MKIARRFNAGIAAKHVQVPEGRPESAAFQASLRDASATTPTPSVETLGYFRMSLRDRAAGRASQILVTLDRNVRAPASVGVPHDAPRNAPDWRRRLSNPRSS